jgi:hypothetical protein
MKLLYWNIRAIGRSHKLPRKNYYQTHKLDFVFIAETMISSSQVPMWFWKNHNVTTFGVNDRGVKDPISGP